MPPKERAIPFSTAGVKALLAGGTRTWQPAPAYGGHASILSREEWASRALSGTDPYGARPSSSYVLEEEVLKCPYGPPGTKLWVRETFATRVDTVPGSEKAKHYLMYRADGSDPHDPMNWHQWTGWKPSTHMPRWASRITLELTSVGLRRLLDLTEAEAEAEGLSYSWTTPSWCWVLEVRFLERTDV